MDNKIDSNSKSSSSTSVSLSVSSQHDNQIELIKSLNESKQHSNSLEHKNSNGSSSDALNSIVSKNGATLEFYGINSVAKNKVILEDINGYCPAGSLLALMGPSGAGKSSLLNTLCRRTIMLGGAKITGKMYINQVPMKSSDSHRIGYVMQDDIFFANLTLRETMRFYGKVRLPDTMSNEEKKARIDEVLEVLEIKKNLDTLIGGGFVRGLSGGERKRANVAVEMIPNPDILILDEPTSGLDSGMALSLIKTLKNLAVNTNKTIISSIHQPNSQIFYSFDYLLLLSYGQMHYFGKVSELVSFYDGINFYCYENWNMADYIIDMARAKPEEREIIVNACKKRKLYLTEKLYEDRLKTNSDNQMAVFDQQKYSYTNGSWSQIKALLRRNFVRSINEYITFLDLLDAILIGAIIGIVYFQKKFSESNYLDIVTMMFFPALSTFLQPLFLNVFAFNTERHVIVRERSSKMYRVSSYYFAKTISELPIAFFRPLIFFTILYFLSGFSYSVYYIPSLLLIFLVALCGQTIGVLFSSFGLEQRETMILVTLYMVISLQAGGVFNRAIPIWLSWIRYISPIFHGYIILYRLQFYGFGGIKCDKGVDSMFEACRQNMEVAPFSEIVTLEQLQVPLYGMIIIFLALIILARVFSLFFLSKSLKRRPLSTGVDFKLFVKKTKVKKDV